MDDPFVSSEDFPVRCHKIAFRNGLSGIFFDKGSVIAVRDKTDILTVRFVCIDEALFLSYLTNFRLGIGSQGEKCMGKLILSHGIKYIALILGVIQSFYQGLFLAPTVVSGALKGAIFAADIYEKLGYKVVPDSTESRHDIIQAVEFQNREAMIAFCEGIQAAAPVDSYVTPEPWAMPGYDLSLIHI
mgnify:CR=1 FL=1